MWCQDTLLRSHERWRPGAGRAALRAVSESEVDRANECTEGCRSGAVWLLAFQPGQFPRLFDREGTMVRSWQLPIKGWCLWITAANIGRTLAPPVIRGQFFDPGRPFQLLVLVYLSTQCRAYGRLREPSLLQETHLLRTLEGIGRRRAELAAPYVCCTGSLGGDQL